MDDTYREFRYRKLGPSEGLLWGLVKHFDQEPLYSFIPCIIPLMTKRYTTVLYLCETLAVLMSSLQQITNVYECPYFATHFLQSFWFLPQKPPVGSECTTKWNLGLK